MDFSDLGGVQVAQAKGPGMDFSDLGGVSVPQDEGALAAAGRGALRNFPLAQQAAAALAPVNPMAEKKNYSDELAHLTEAAETAKSQHPIAYGAGAVTGAAAPMAIPGVGEAMAASYPAAMAGNGALGAAQAISDTSLTQEPGKAAKEAAIGGGIGAGLGALGKWVGKTIPTPEEAEAGAIAQKLEIPGRSLLNAIGNDVEGGLKSIGETLRETTLPDGSTLNDLSDSPLRFAGKVGEALDMYGKKIGEVVGKIDEQMPVKPLTDTIDGMAQSTNGLAVRNQYLDQINRILKSNADKNGEISFGKLRDLANHIYREMVVEDPATGRLAPGSEKALEAWRFLRGLEDDIVKTSKPKLYQQFSDSSRHYSNLVDIAKKLNSVALRQEAKQTNVSGLFNPLGWGSKVGKVVEGATGLNRINNVPFKVMPAVNALRGVAPKNVPQSEAADLADFLTRKFGDKEK